MDGNRRTSPGVEPPAAQLLCAFVNTLDVETAADTLDTPGHLVEWLAAHALVHGRARAGRDDLATARALREGLRAAMLAHHGPADALATPDEELEPALARLPLRLALSGGRPTLVPLRGGYVQGGDVQGGDVQGGDAAEGLARIAAAVMASVADGSWPRLKVCQEHSCLWAFLDTSKNRSRSWCSMRVCGNRTKTRTYRARRRASPGPGAGTVDGT